MLGENIMTAPLSWRVTQQSYADGKRRRNTTGLSPRWTADLIRSKINNHEPVDLDAYFKLFTPYEKQLRQFSGREGEHGGRFALLFRQVLRLLMLPSELNRLVPKPFIKVAQRYLAKDREVVMHFSYEDNRHFFLSDLHDWLKIQARGQRMRRMGR